MALTAKKVYAILKRQISDMEAKLNSPLRYRGTVATADLLPSNPDIGDMYNIESKSVYGEAGMNVAWNGVVWDTMGAPIDMSLYLTKEEAEAVIQRLVTEYFEKNPVKPGATTEQAKQIEQNKADVASLKEETGSLKEDLSTKITKFYASSQGEAHITDSDNGKIMDMMIYGKSEQKQYSGKNLLKATLQTTTKNGVTCTANGDGTYTLNGTATERTEFTIDVFNIDISKKYKLIAFTKERSYINCFVQLNQSPWTIYGTSTDSQVTITDSKNIRLVIAVIKGTTLSNEIIKPMVVDASLYPDATYDDFEPYTGGIPSPNPDYPQEIKSVVNPTVKVCGKNLYTYHNLISNFAGIKITRDGSNITLDGTANANGPEDVNTVLKNVFLKKGTYTLSYNIESGSKTLVGDNLFRISSNKPLATSIQVFITGTNNAVAFTLNEDVHASVICRINSGSVYNNCKFNIQIEAGSTPTAYEPYHEQTVTLPYTLNAIPVSSGGNVTIDGQQYVADYVDVERGKLVRMVQKRVLNGTEKWRMTNSEKYNYFALTTSDDAKLQSILPNNKNIRCNLFKAGELNENNILRLGGYERIQIRCDSANTVEEFKNMLSAKKAVCYFILQTPFEINLTTEEVQTLKALATYYPTTNISINSEQLDSYTVFNYPISMQNGWNYVKQQIGDTRDYIYDMDARTQDTDLQAAEAYVNSEYAVALTELEV